MHKITENEVSTISSHSHSHIRVLLYYPVDKSCKQSISYSKVYTHIDTHTDIHTDHLLKMLFSDSGDLKTCKSIKISILKISPQNNTFSTYR